MSQLRKSVGAASHLGSPRVNRASLTDQEGHRFAIPTARKRPVCIVKGCRIALGNGRKPPESASALVVLFDGAVAGSEVDGPQRARDARWMAKKSLAG